MNKFFLSIIFLLILTFPALAKVDVITSYPYIKDITERIGGNNVQVNSLASGDRDPHFIVPRPSLIAKARKADLLIINGAQLEIGWLPPIINKANNPNIQPGTKGLMDLSVYIEKIQVPQNVSRGQGDVHPQGNPHFNLNPNNILIISKAITERLCLIDSANCSEYKKNYISFSKKWENKLVEWKKKLNGIKGLKIFEYHRVFDYFTEFYNLEISGTLEPLPGIPPTPKHINDLISISENNNIKFNIRTIYNPLDPSKYLSDKTKIKLLTLPHDVDATKEATDVFKLFDIIVNELTKN